MSATLPPAQVSQVRLIVPVALAFCAFLVGNFVADIVVNQLALVPLAAQELVSPAGVVVSVLIGLLFAVSLRAWLRVRASARREHELLPGVARAVPYLLFGGAVAGLGFGAWQRTKISRSELESARARCAAVLATSEPSAMDTCLPLGVRCGRLPRDDGASVPADVRCLREALTSSPSAPSSPSPTGTSR